MALSQTQVSELYVAIFNRASEGKGNTFWQEGGLSAAQTADAMLNTADAEAYFGDSLDTNESFIEQIYSSTLNKTAEQDPEGIAYWVEQLDNGMSRGEVVAGLVDAIAQYEDSEDPATQEAYAQFQNRVDVSDYTADNLQNAPEGYVNSLQFGKGLDVTSDDATVAGATDTVDGIEDIEPEDPGVEGDTISLTAGADDLTGDNAGTADNDTFEAGLGQTDQGFIVNTLSSADKIDGGAGNDTLNASLSAEVNLAGDALNVQPTTRDVENINIEARSGGGDDENPAGTVNLDAKNMVGVDTFGSDYSDGDLVIQNVNTLDGDGGIRNTGDITVRMDHTSNFNSIGDASDLTVLFDDDYLISGEETKTSLQLRIVNTYELAENDNPLTDFESVDFTVGGEDVSVDLTGVETYEDVAGAINAKLNDLGIEGVEASTAEPRTAVFTDDLDGYEQGELAGNYMPVDIVSASGDLEPGTIKRASDVADFDGLNTWVAGGSQTTDDPVSVNVELEKVGRAGEGGNLVIGGKSQTVVDGQENGIQVFNIEVQGDASQPSNLGSITSTNDKLETVNIVTDPSRLGSDDLADLTVRGEEVFKIDADGEPVLEDGEPVVDPENSIGAFGGIDGQADTYIDTVDASGFEGNLTLGSDVAVQNLGTLNATGGGDVTFNGNYTDEANHVVTTGAGDDVINLEGDGEATVTTGEGNDTITGGGVSIDVDGGAGNDAIYVDNSGDKTNADGTATVVKTDDLTQSIGDEDDNYGLLNGRGVTVTVNSDVESGGLAEALANGFEGRARIESNNIDGAKYLTNKADLNDAVITAVEGSEVLSDLVEVEVNSDGELEFTSKIDGDNVSVNIGVGSSNWNDSDTAALQSEYQAEYSNSKLEVGKQDSIGLDEAVELEGTKASDTANDNVVHLSGGEDTIVLSTSDGTDTIVFDESFGTSSIVNFDAENDELDFSAYLDSMKSDSGSTESQELIETTYENDTELSANEVNFQDFTQNGGVTSFSDLTADNLLDMIDFSTEGNSTAKELVDGEGSAIVMVQDSASGDNAGNAGEYKVFEVTFDGAAEDYDLSASDIELIGTADFGAGIEDALIA